MLHETTVYLKLFFTDDDSLSVKHIRLASTAPSYDLPETLFPTLVQGPHGMCSC